MNYKLKKLWISSIFLIPCFCMILFLNSTSFAVSDDSTISLHRKIDELEQKATESDVLVNTSVELIERTFLQEQNINNAVYFSQLDDRWAYHAFGDGRYGNILNTGCGPTSCSMVVSSLKNIRVTPDQMADFGMAGGYNMGNSGSSWSLFPAVAEHWNLNYAFSNNPEDAIDCLKKGGYVIASQTPGLGNYWTSCGHFIVITGMLDNNTFMVNDPSSKERTERSHTYEQVFSPNKGLFLFWKK